VQATFGTVFNAGTEFARDGSQFDHLFADGEHYQIGHLQAQAWSTPGHTPACMSHVIGDAVFVGDTLFMPDYGTARCDFPRGSAAILFDSVQRLFELPESTRVFLCHDYLPETRDRYVCETDIQTQKNRNIHIHHGTSKAEFVEMRNKRDAGLSMPKLILPSIQINMKAGQFPEPEENGVSYLKLPLNYFK